MLRLKFDDIPLTTLSEDEFDEKIKEYVFSGKPHQIVTFNSLMYIEMKKNRAFSEAVLNSSLVIPESAGISWAVKFLYNHKIKSIAGIDLVFRMLRLASQNKFSVFLLGSSSEVVEKATERLKSIFPALRIAGFHSGYFSDEESDDVVKKIAASAADIIFVGLGIPKQEVWISKNLKGMNVKVAMGVGGSFDVISGKLKRAPDIFRNFSLEWLYRLIQEPRRAGRMINLPIFVYKVLKMKMSRRNPV